MQIIRAALCGAVLALASGCGLFSPMRHDSRKFDPQCPAWQEQIRRHDKSEQAIAESRGVESYYEYYMCLEMMSAMPPDVDRMRYFADHVDDFIRIAPDRLRKPRHWKELYALSCILRVIHVNKIYNVGADKNLMSTWSESIIRNDENFSMFNNSPYLMVVQSPY